MLIVDLINSSFIIKAVSAINHKQTPLNVSFMRRFLQRSRIKRNISVRSLIDFSLATA